MAWKQFMNRLQPKVKELMLKVEESDEWVTLRGINGHRIVIEKTKTQLPKIESTFGPSVLDKDIADLVVDNGRIVSLIRIEILRTRGIGLVENMLELLVDPELPLVPPRRGGKDRSVPSVDSLLERN